MSKTTPAGGDAARGNEGPWVRVVRDWDGVEAHGYCSRRCAEDPVYGLVGARPAPAVPGAAPQFCARCGLPVGNALSADGRRRARELLDEIAGWQADALCERYRLGPPRRIGRRRRQAEGESRWAA
jgi:hypothetical protein